MSGQPWAEGPVGNTGKDNSKDANNTGNPLHGNKLGAATPQGYFGMESPAIKFAWADTAEITQLYLQRPACIATLRLGQWFLQAHGIKDREIELAASSLETKLLIVRKGLNSLALEPLETFNQRNAA